MAVGIVVIALVVVVGVLIGYGWATDKDAPSAGHDNG
jgi:hypothetical protein